MQEAADGFCRELAARRPGGGKIGGFFVDIPHGK